MDANLMSELKNVRVAISKQDPIIPELGFPDGTHNALPESMVLGKAKSSDRIQIDWVWKGVDGDIKDKAHHDYCSIASKDATGNVVMDEMGVGLFKGKCQVIGLDLSKDIYKWPEQLEAFCQKNTEVFSIKIFTNKKGFKGVNILGSANPEELGVGTTDNIEGLDDGLGELNLGADAGNTDELGLDDIPAPVAKPKPTGRVAGKR